MSDDTPTVRSRMLAGGISEDRIADHHAAGRIQLDGVKVDDLDTPAPEGTRIVLGRA